MRGGDPRDEDRKDGGGGEGPDAPFESVLNREENAEDWEGSRWGGRGALEINSNNGSFP